MSFSFGFSGDDIDAEADDALTQKSQTPPQPPPPTSSSAAQSAFPVQGKPQLPPTHHPLSSLISQLPSKIAYGFVDVELDDGTPLRIPRRELWDVRVQLMAEDDGSKGEVEGLGRHDVKTGVYEGGFKSWESSVDLVKVLAADVDLLNNYLQVIELGCGTALPSLAMLQWAMGTQFTSRPLSIVLADYNPSVLQLVTLPNMILTWAFVHATTSLQLEQAIMRDGELDLTPEVLRAFQDFLFNNQIYLTFISGAWSHDLVDLIQQQQREINPSPPSTRNTLLLGAETIYSPFALQAFAETTFEILQREAAKPEAQATALVAAKRLYFGVGGSLDDFIANARERGGVVTELRDESEGVRRGVVRCALAS